MNRAAAAGLSCTPGDLRPLELKGEISYLSNCLLCNKNDSVALSMNSPREGAAGGSWGKKIFFNQMSKQELRALL